MPKWNQVPRIAYFEGGEVFIKYFIFVFDFSKYNKPTGLDVYILFLHLVFSIAGKFDSVHAGGDSRLVDFS